MEQTIKGWRIGYNAQDQELHGLWIQRGIVIPCFSPDWLVWYLKVRRPVPDPPAYDPQRHGPKYVQVKGAGRGALFGLSHLSDHRTLVLCEGELDAILLWQEAGILVDVAATGSAMTRPAPQFLAHLAGHVHWLVALDRDKAGDAGAVWWDDFSQRVRRVRPLQGNDLTDFHQDGGDLKAWITYHLEKLYPTPTVEEQADAVLARMATDPQAAREYAELAEAQGWPCDGYDSWREWLVGVTSG